jgi:hypothetical protein
MPFLSARTRGAKYAAANYARSASCLSSKRHKCAKRLASGALEVD